MATKKIMCSSANRYVRATDWNSSDTAMRVDFNLPSAMSSYLFLYPNGNQVTDVQLSFYITENTNEPSAPSSINKSFYYAKRFYDSAINITHGWGPYGALPKTLRTWVGGWNTLSLGAISDFTAISLGIYFDFDGGVDGKSWSLGEIGSAYAPYVTIIYGPNPPPAPGLTSPLDTTVNPREAIEFKWEAESQTKFEFEWSLDGQHYQALAVSSPNRSYTLPQGSINVVTGSLYWRVRVWANYSADPSPYASGTCAIQVLPPPQPSSLSPGSQTVDPRKAITFSWAGHLQQSKFELQYRLNGGAWVTITQNTNLRRYTLPAGTITLTSGVMDWRVRYWVPWLAEATDYGEATTTIEVPPPEVPTSLSPSDQEMDPRKPMVLAWNATIEQTKYELQYRLNGGAWTTVTISSYARSHTLPANTFGVSTGTVDWRVRVWYRYTSVASQYGSATIKLKTLPQKPPVLLHPIDEYIRDKQIRFAWYFVPNSIETQKSFELRYRFGDSVAWTTVTGTIAQEFVLTHGIFESTVGEWQMRVTNNYNDVSPWTDIIRFTIIGVPGIPQIVSVTDENRPLITWTSNDQASYRIQVWKGTDLLYDSKDVIDMAARAHRVQTDLETGEYQVQIYVVNEFGVRSPIAEYAFVVAESGLPIPWVRAYDDRFCCHVQTSPSVEIYRDLMYIGVSDEDGRYDDFGAINRVEHSYTVKSRAGNRVSESSRATAHCHFSGDTLALRSDPAHMICLYLTSNPKEKRGRTLTAIASMVHLEGRALPFYEYSENETEVLTREYWVSYADYDKLCQLIQAREELLYRDRDGWNWTVAADTLPGEEDRDLGGYQVSLTLTKVEE